MPPLEFGHDFKSDTNREAVQHQDHSLPPIREMTIDQQLLHFGHELIQFDQELMQYARQILNEINQGQATESSAPGGSRHQL